MEKHHDVSLSLHQRNFPLEKETKRKVEVCICYARRVTGTLHPRERGEKFFTSSFSFGWEENESAGIKGSWRGRGNGNGGSFGLPWKIRNIPPEATIERCMLYARS